MSSRGAESTWWRPDSRRIRAPFVVSANLTLSDDRPPLRSFRFPAQLIGPPARSTTGVTSPARQSQADKTEPEQRERSWFGHRDRRLRQQELIKVRAHLQ